MEIQNELTLKKLGDLLRQKRLEMNLSVKEAENATSIRSPYLVALEEGEGSRLISPVYAQGFFKQYASFLGLDGEQILRDHPGAFQRAETQSFDYGIGTLEGRGNLSAGVKWFPGVLWTFVFILLLASAWYLALILEVL